MTIREDWTPRQEAVAKAVYQEIMKHKPTLAAPMQRWEVANRVGIGENEVSEAVHWARRKIAVSAQNYIASKKGPGGGYYIAKSAQQIMDSGVSEFSELFNRTLRDVAMVRAGMSKLPAVTGRRTLRSGENFLVDLREALTDLGADPGLISA